MTTRRLPPGYEPCPRAGCTVPVAPHDDHYHCGKCDSPQITGPYGHYHRGWTCDFAERPSPYPTRS